MNEAHSELDTRFMRRALALAERGAGHVSPNPLVGAVVVKEEAIVGEGWHAVVGSDHAEVVALRNAGENAKGATIYVNLEPCNHTGRTPPCVDAIIAAGIARVVFAISDPNPIARGGGDSLRTAGIEVVTDVLSSDASELNQSFLFAARGAVRPWITLKLALSIDGAVVDKSRVRGWLTGAEAQRAVHVLRANSDAVAVGIGTVLADDPMLTVREAAAPRVPPIRVLFDRAARIPLGSQLVKSAHDSPVLLLTQGKSASREMALKAAGLEIVRVNDIREGMEALRARGVRSLLVEGGAVMASALMVADLVDRLIIFQAPVILGRDAVGAFSGAPPQRAGSAPRFRVIARRELGADLMTIYAVSTD
ncbi:MAG: bifunctional diaminohydroxyphosphoribosylaminopyrimidine deaminase/5-amino-6-(5-phosphoribosylamino)uracil reductase RibD [Gemmatimonadaceae bacterium]